MAKDAEWAGRPKPKVDVEPPKDIANAADLIGRTRLLFDLSHLALQNDSTRLITIMLAGSSFAPPIQGVSLGHHDLSHHGKDPSKLAQLKIVEMETMKTVRDLLGKLAQSREGEQTLLDRTIVYLGSNLGDASSHSTKNLPVLLAGGGFQHGQHLAFEPRQSSATVQSLRQHASATGHRIRPIRLEHRHTYRTRQRPIVEQLRFESFLSPIFCPILN